MNVWSIVAMLVAISLISVGVVQQTTFAQEAGMAMRATSDEGSDTISIMGKTFLRTTDIAFKVTAPNGVNVVEIGQVSPDTNGEFALDIKTNLWKQSGYYTVLARQDNSAFHTLKLEVEVIDGITRQTDERATNLSTDIFADADILEEMGLELYPIMVEVGTTEFEVMGRTDRVEQDVTIIITSPGFGNRVTAAQVVPDQDGEFVANISVKGPLWKEDGNYTVTAQQGSDPEYTDSTQIEILDGVIVPEFGAIAMLILAVAIISMIIVSARSRLGIIPKY